MAPARRLPLRALAGRFHDLAIPLALATGAFALLQAAVLLSVVTAGAAAGVTARMPLPIELQRTAPDQPVQAFLSLLLRLPPVAHVAFVTKEQRYEEQRRFSPEDLPFLDRYVRDNPLADTAMITLRSPRDAGAFLAFLKRPVFQSVLDPGFLWGVAVWQRGVAQEILRWRSMHLLGIAASALGMLLVLGAGLVHAHACHERERDRLAAMVRAGAEPLRITAPFVAGQAAMLAAAAVLAALLLGGGGMLLWSSFPELAMAFPLPPLVEVFPWLLFVSFLGVMCGAILAMIPLPLSPDGTHLHLRGHHPPEHGRR